MVRRNDVIDAAAAILREDGPDALTSVSVAKRLNITQSAIYRHVSDMGRLTTMASELVVSELDVSVREVLGSPDAGWGDGAYITEFSRHLVDAINEHATTFEIVDRWRFDDGELGAGIRTILQSGRTLIADIIESEWRKDFGWTGKLDASERAAQLAYAQLLQDDVLSIARLTRGDRPISTDDAVRTCRVHVYGGWLAYTLDMNQRVGLEAPSPPVPVLS